MALTPRRATLGAVALSAFIALAYLPPSLEPVGPKFITRGPRTVERRAANSARSRLARAARQFLQSRHRDSLLAFLREPPPDTPFVRFSEDMSRPDRDWFLREVSQRWNLLGQMSGAYTVGISVIIDTAVEFASFERRRARWWRPSFYYYLPASLDDRACVTVVRLGRPTSEENGEFPWRLGDGERAALFGPCAFYAIFGKSGRTLAQWLDSPSGFIALSFDTAVSPVPVREERDRTLDLSNWVPGSWQQYRAHDLDIPACLVGRTDRCSYLVSGPASPLRFVLPADVPVLEGVRTYAYAAGSYESFLLSDLLAEKGRDAFAVFWQSNEPLEQAFATAFGEPLGEFVHRWIQSYVLPLPRGWRLPASSIFISVVLLVGLVVAGAAHATTRRVDAS